MVFVAEKCESNPLFFAYETNVETVSLFRNVKTQYMGFKPMYSNASVYLLLYSKPFKASQRLS